MDIFANLLLKPFNHSRLKLTLKLINNNKMLHTFSEKVVLKSQKRESPKGQRCHPLPKSCRLGSVRHRRTTNRITVRNALKSR
jgi:hypothetical protein